MKHVKAVSQTPILADEAPIDAQFVIDILTAFANMADSLLQLQLPLLIRLKGNEGKTL
jgi:hypothetical protein